MAPAVQALQRVLAEEPTNEEAHVGLMRLLASSGRSGEALRQYDGSRNALQRVLGLSQRLHPQPQRGDSGRRAPDWPYPARRRPSEQFAEREGGTHNLPAQRTLFIGRERR